MINPEILRLHDMYFEVMSEDHCLLIADRLSILSDYTKSVDLLSRSDFKDLVDMITNTEVLTNK